MKCTFCPNETEGELRTITGLPICETCANTCPALLRDTNKEKREKVKKLAKLILMVTEPKKEA